MVASSSAFTRLDQSHTFREFEAEMNRKMYIGHKVFPPLVVDAQASDFPKIKLEQLLQSHDTSRAPDGGYRSATWETTNDNYACMPYGWKEKIDDWSKRVYGSMIDVENVASGRVLQFITDHYERDCASTLFDTATWTGAALTTAISIPWSTAATAVPTANIRAAREKVITGCGLMPNTLVLSFLAFDYLRNTAEVKDAIKQVQVADQMNLGAAVADVIGVKRIVIAGGLKNTANAQADRSISRIWSDTMAMLCVTAETNDLQEPCVGRTLMWSEWGGSGAIDGEGIAVAMDEYRDEDKESTFLRGRNNRHIKKLYVQAGHLMTAVTA